MAHSPPIFSLAIREQQVWRADTIHHGAILASACALLTELTQTWSQNGFEGRESLERLRQSAASPNSPRQAAVQEAALRALAQYNDSDPTGWETAHVERAQNSLREELVSLLERDLASEPIKFIEVHESQPKLLNLLELQRRLDAVPPHHQTASALEQDQAWIAQVGPLGPIRLKGRDWIAAECGAEDREILWERLCDTIYAHEKREFFADDAGRRLQEYASFGRRLMALWEAHREIDPAVASEFLATEEIAEVLAGTCHTGWQTRLVHLEHMLQLARHARGLTEFPPDLLHVGLFLSGAELGAHWRRQVMRDVVLPRVAQTLCLYDEQTGAVDAHVLPSLMQTCNEAFALGLARWEREEIWVEEFQEILLEEGEPGPELSQWFWGEADSKSVQAGLFGVLEGAFMTADSDEQGRLFDFLLDWYQSDRLDGAAFEIPSAELEILRQIERALQEALEEQSPPKMMRALTGLAKQMGLPFYEQPSDRAWKQLMRACEGERHITLMTRLRILRHQHTDAEPRDLVKTLTRFGPGQEPTASEILESMHEPSIAQALTLWQQSADPEVRKEFLEQELPRAAAAALQSLPDLKVREQMSSLRNLLVTVRTQADGVEQLRITPFGLRSWAALLGLIRFQAEESSSEYVASLTQWINQAGNRQDHPRKLLGLQQEQSVIRWVREDGLRLEHLPPRFQRQIPVVMTAVAQNGLALQFAEGASRRNREIAFAAVLENPAALEWVSHPLRTDRGLVQEAVRRDGLTLQFARYPALHDKALVLEAVRQNGMALQYAPDHLREDSEVIQAAVEQNRDASAFILRPGD